MKKYKTVQILLITVISLSWGDVADIMAHTTVKNEILELGAAAAAAAVTEFYLSKSPVWTDHPLLRTSTHGIYKTETVSDVWLYPVGLAMAGGIGFSPNAGGTMNFEAYTHVKGFLESSFAVIPLINEIVKHAVGKKRPNYDSGMNLYNEGESVDINDLSKSFYSGQASISFGMATYFSLFLFKNVEADQTRALFWKVPLSAASCAFATYVSYTRVHDNLHEPIDVIVGGMSGAVIAAGMYFFNEKRIRIGTGKMAVVTSGNSISLQF